MADPEDTRKDAIDPGLNHLRVLALQVENPDTSPAERETLSKYIENYLDQYNKSTLIEFVQAYEKLNHPSQDVFFKELTNLLRNSQ